MLDMTSDDTPTNAGKDVTSTIACARMQRYTTYCVFWLAQYTLWIMTLCHVPPFFGPNVYSDGPTNGLSIRRLWMTSVVTYAQCFRIWRRTKSGMVKYTWTKTASLNHCLQNAKHVMYIRCFQHKQRLPQLLG